LKNLELNFERYFPSYDEAEHRQKLWILNPFDGNAIEQAGVLEEIKEQLFVLSTDSALKMQGMGFHEVPEFWQKMNVHYKQLSNMALTELHLFASTCLCEASFSAVTV
jgi:hypothetical protein